MLGGHRLHLDTRAQMFWVEVPKTFVCGNSLFKVSSSLEVAGGKAQDAGNRVLGKGWGDLSLHRGGKVGVRLLVMPILSPPATRDSGICGSQHLVGP